MCKHSLGLFGVPPTSCFHTGPAADILFPISVCGLVLQRDSSCSVLWRFETRRLSSMWKQVCLSEEAHTHKKVRSVWPADPLQTLCCLQQLLPEQIHGGSVQKDKLLLRAKASAASGFTGRFFLPESDKQTAVSLVFKEKSFAVSSSFSFHCFSSFISVLKRKNQSIFSFIEENLKVEEGQRQQKGGI